MTLWMMSTYSCCIPEVCDIWTGGDEHRLSYKIYCTLLYSSISQAYRKWNKKYTESASTIHIRCCYYDFSKRERMNYVDVSGYRLLMTMKLLDGVRTKTRHVIVKQKV
jgi:hypothetical protein